MRKILVIAAFVSACALTGCYLSGPCFQGYGPVETEVRDIEGFTEVVNAGSFEVRVTHADSFRVEVTAQENLLSIIETYVSGNELKIKTRNGTCINSNSQVVVYVKMPLLEGIKNTGSGQLLADRAECIFFECTNTGSGLTVIDSVYAVTAIIENTGSGKIYMKGSYVDEIIISQDGSGYIQAGDVYGTYTFDVEHNSSGRIYAAIFDGDEVKINMDGSGGIGLLGEAKQANYHLTGSGKIDALDLMVSEATATNDGSGKIFLYATDVLNVSISGSGDVFYLGDPDISLNKSGSGDLKYLGN